MKTNVVIFLAALLSASVMGVGGQTPPPPTRAPVNAPASASCPKIEIQGMGGRIVRDGQPVTFVASITGGDANVAPTIVWSVSAGTVRGGQGTRGIEVDSTGAGNDRQIVAEIWLGGYPPECIVQASATVRVAGPATKVDEFAELAPQLETERLEELAAAVPQSDNIYVIGYAGRNNVRGYAGTALKRIKDQLIKSGLAASRIAVVDGGFREAPAFELWIVPTGAEAPRPTPTVDRKDIVYPKPTPAKKP